MKAEDFDDPIKLARLYFAYLNTSGHSSAKYIVVLCEALAKERSWDLAIYKADVEQEWREEEAKTKALRQAQEDAQRAKRARNFQKKYGMPPINPY